MQQDLADDKRIFGKVQRELNPLNAAFPEAGLQAGHGTTQDVNGYRQEGVSRFEMSVEKGYRGTSARAYLHTQSARSAQAPSVHLKF